MIERSFIAASAEFLSTKEPVSSTSVVSDAFLFDKVRTVSWITAKSSATNVFSSSLPSNDSASLVVMPNTLVKLSSHDETVFDEYRESIVSPSLDAFLYVRSKSETGLQTEVEGAFNTKEGVFFWG